jgi:hypothetical protein
MFLEISGVGTVKNEKYGPLFTALIREHEEEHPTQFPPEAALMGS